MNVQSTDIKTGLELLKFVIDHFNGTEYEYTNYKGEIEKDVYNILDEDDEDEIDYNDPEILYMRNSSIVKEGYILKYEDGYGGEGQGDERWECYSVTFPDGVKKYLYFEGYYQSWDGTNWEKPPVIAEPYQVVITKFSSIE